MLKLHQIFLYNFLAIFFFAFILAIVLSYFFLKSIEISQFTHNLKNSVSLVELELQKVHNYDQLAQDVRRQTGLRFTLINEAGVVEAESHKDRKSMDNHGHRLEILEAKRNTFGIAIRYSHTILQNLLYVAKKVNIGTNIYYIRLAISLKRIMDDFYKLWIQVSMIFSLFIIIAFLVTLRISRGISKDVNRLTNYLKEVDNKHYRATLKTNFSYEFINIASTLRSVIAKLDRREKQRRKYTAKLKLINKQRNDLLSAISHEFKNPLAAIQGYAQTIQSDLDSDEKHAVPQKFLGKIVQNTQKITSMLDRIALSVKLENHDLQPHFEQTDLYEIAQDAMHTIEKKYPNRTITIEGKSKLIACDPTMMELVIVNLLDNAMKYSEDGVRLKIGKKRLSVIDHGLGIEQEELEKITSKFYRIDKNSWDNSMGLGLAIVSYILHLHHTQLEMRSELGKGSVFSFYYA